MEQNIYGYNPNAELQNRSIAFPALMNKVYTWMALALAITGLTALVVANNEQLVYAIANNRDLFWGLVIGEVALVWITSATMNQISLALAGILFGIYAILNGVTMSLIFLAYTAESIASTFFITAGTFGAMSLIGTFTKKDLSTIGRFCFMALIGIIIASIVNIFMQSSALYWGISFVGVLLFCGLTAYDTQKIRELLEDAAMSGDDTTAGKIALMGSLELYLDFINLFLYLLRFLGNRK